MAKPNPCDYIEIPVFSTYMSAGGLVAFREMFGDDNHIILRWYGDDARMHQTLVKRPDTWADGRAYYDPQKREWDASGDY